MWSCTGASSSSFICPWDTVSPRLSPPMTGLFITRPSRQLWKALWEGMQMVTYSFHEQMIQDPACARLSPVLREAPARAWVRPVAQTSQHHAWRVIPRHESAVPTIPYREWTCDTSYRFDHKLKSDISTKGRQWNISLTDSQTLKSSGMTVTEVSSEEENTRRATCQEVAI